MSDDLFQQAQNLASKGRMKAAKFTLETAIELMTPEDLAATNQMDFHEAMSWFKLLVETGLDEAQEGPIRSFYLDVTAQALATAPEEIRVDLHQKIDELWPGLRQMACKGYDGETNEAVYDLDATCEFLGVDREEAIRVLEKRGHLREAGKHQVHTVH
ncbi:MAG: hypothetical protein HQK56_06515 [Deltaproteobacteria bacterium]|nr:hypothetical protein [Deltaproteobacteria bacterium]